MSSINHEHREISHNWDGLKSLGLALVLPPIWFSRRANSWGLLLECSTIIGSAALITSLYNKSNFRVNGKVSLPNIAKFTAAVGWALAHNYVYYNYTFSRR